MIRPARAADLPALVALDRDLFPRPWGAEGWARELGRVDGWIEVVEGDRGDLLAACCGWVAAGEAEVLRVMTRPEVRRRGLAGDLLARFRATAEAGGAERIFLEVDAGNEAACALYAKHGFLPVGRRPGYYAPFGGDALVLSLACRPGGRPS